MFFLAKHLSLNVLSSTLNKCVTPKFVNIQSRPLFKEKQNKGKFYFTKFVPNAFLIELLDMKSENSVTDSSRIVHLFISSCEFVFSKKSNIRSDQELFFKRSRNRKKRTMRNEAVTKCLRLIKVPLLFANHPFIRNLGRIKNKQKTKDTKAKKKKKTPKLQNKGSQKRK
jgi:hypothetical protein